MSNDIKHLMKLLELAEQDERARTTLDDVLYVLQFGPEALRVCLRRVAAHYAWQVNQVIEKGKQP